MKLAFTKMHGCGNNYIYFNCFDQTVPDPESLSIKLSEPHFGIGGDGIILISPSDKADAQMRIFNADGSEGKMCGNGIRCVGKYLYDNGMTDGRTTITIDTLSGVKTLELTVKDGKCSPPAWTWVQPFLLRGRFPLIWTAKMSSAHPSLWTKRSTT